MSQKKNKNTTLKILSLFIAIFLWSIVMSEVNPVISNEYRGIPLELSNIESIGREGLKILEPQDGTITVVLSGKTNDIRKFKRQNIKALVDLAEFSKEEGKAPIRVSLPPEETSIKIVDYSPKEAQISYDELVSVEREIKVMTEGKLEDESYILGDMNLKQKTVVLEGPKSHIERVSEVVAFVDLEGRKKDIIINTPIRLLNDEGNDVEGISLNRNSVDVEIKILRSKIVNIEIDTNRPIPAEYQEGQIWIDPKRIGIKGREKVLSIKSIKTQKIDLDELMDKGELNISLVLPEDVDLVNDEEIKIYFSPNKYVEKAFKYDEKQVLLQGLDSNLSADLEFDTEINILVKGVTSIVEDTVIGDLNLFVDLKDLKEGKYDLPLIIETKKDFESIDISPKTVKVTIEAKN